MAGPACDYSLTRCRHELPALVEAGPPEPPKVEDDVNLEPADGENVQQAAQPKGAVPKGADQQPT